MKFVMGRQVMMDGFAIADFFVLKSFSTRRKECRKIEFKFDKLVGVLAFFCCSGVDSFFCESNLYIAY